MFFDTEHPPVSGRRTEGFPEEYRKLRHPWMKGIEALQALARKGGQALDTLPSRQSRSVLFKHRKSRMTFAVSRIDLKAIQNSKFSRAFPDNMPACGG